MGNAEGVDVVAEGSTVELVDGIDDFILGDGKVVGEEEDGEVEVEKGLLRLDEVFNLSGEGGVFAGGARARRLRQAFGAVGNHVDGAPDVEEDEGEGCAVEEVELEAAAGGEGVEDLAEGHDEEAEVGGEVEAFEVEVAEEVGGVVFGADATETEELANAVDEDEEEFETENSPEKIGVGKDDEVVAPVARQEGPGQSLSAAEGPETESVGSADEGGDNHKGNAEERGQ